MGQTLTLRRRAADTDARDIRDGLVIRRGAYELSKVTILAASTRNKCLGAFQVVLIEVAGTLLVQAARYRERHGALAHSNDGSDGCGSHG